MGNCRLLCLRSWIVSTEALSRALPPSKLELRTPARSGEASHSRAGEAATEDLRKEFSSFKEQVFQELDGMRSKVARSTPQPQPKKTKTVASPPGAGRSEADPPGDAS